MKTAVSLDDGLFRRAEDMARRLGIPRSQLYARALAEYLDSHSPQQVTAALDTLYSGAPSTLDPAIAAAQQAAVAEDNW